MREILNQTIDMNDSLWRYFKSEYIVDFLQTGKLYFASARQFEDSFEGAVAVSLQSYLINNEPERNNSNEKAFEELCRLTKISCWHRSSHESDAMWRLYADDRKGVAIRTTPAKMKSAIKPFKLGPEFMSEDIWAGNITYINLLQESLNVSMLERFWYKHMVFSWEQEFRLAISLRIAEEFGCKVPPEGIFVEFDMQELVEEIYLGPLLSEADIQNISEAAETCGLGARIRISSLRGTPKYIL